MVVTASWDKTARLWDVASGTKPRVLRGHHRTVVSAQFSPDRRMVVTASRDHSARLWDVVSGKELRVLCYEKDDKDEKCDNDKENAQVHSAEFSPDGKTVLTANEDKTVRLWDVATGQQQRKLLGHEDEINSAEFSLDDKMVVTASDDKTARLWDVATGRQTRKLGGRKSVGHKLEVNSVSFSHDDKKVVTAGKDKTVRVWDVASGTPLHVWHAHNEAIYTAEFSRDTKRWSPPAKTRRYGCGM